MRNRFGGARACTFIFLFLLLISRLTCFVGMTGRRLKRIIRNCKNRFEVRRGNGIAKQRSE